MAESALETYVAGLSDEDAAAVRTLDAAIRKAHAGFDVAVKYRILMYALAGDWRHWVVSVDVTKRGPALRFLAGVIMDDPRGVLRPGTSTLMTWDFDRGARIPVTAVRAYVREAVARYPDYRERAEEITAQAREAHGRRGPRPR
ncbi:MAG: DUF1801 domain-containing protein [Candidatus Nanopelagicales bacterium]